MTGWPPRSLLKRRLLDAIDRGDSPHAYQLVGVLCAQSTWAGDERPPRASGTGAPIPQGATAQWDWRGDPEWNPDPKEKPR